MKDNIAIFIEKIKPFEPLYRSFSLTIMAFKVKGNWINVATEVVLRPQAPSKDVPDPPLPDTDNFVVYREHLDIGALQSVLREIQLGVVRRGEREILLVSSIEPGDPKPMGGLFLHYHPRDNGDEDICGYATHAMRGHGVSLQNIIKDQKSLELALQNLDPPYADFNDLLSSVFIHFRRYDYNVSSDAHVLAPSYIKIGRWGLDGDALAMRIHAPAHADPTLLKIGVIERCDGAAARRYSIAVEAKDGEGNGTYDIRHRIGAAPIVDVILSFNGTTVETIKFLNYEKAKLRPLIHIHEMFDPDFDTLKNYLGIGKKNSLNFFEQGISILLAQAGFHVFPYGTAKAFGDVADGVAIMPLTNRAILYECLTGLSDDKNKFGKFIVRVNQFRRNPCDLEVWPVVFTSLPLGGLPSHDTELLQGETIRVVYAEEIEVILNYIYQGQLLSVVFRFITSLMPY